MTTLVLDSTEAFRGVHEALQQYLDNQDDCPDAHCVNGQEVFPAGAPEPTGGWSLCAKCMGSAKVRTPEVVAVQKLVDQLDRAVARAAR